jgi:hypothetical protein
MQPGRGGNFMKSRLGLAVAAMLCIVSASRANADVWQVDFSSSRLHGSFDIDGSTFVIPLSAAQPPARHVVSIGCLITHGVPHGFLLSAFDPAV